MHDLTTIQNMNMIAAHLSRQELPERNAIDPAVLHESYASLCIVADENDQTVAEFLDDLLPRPIIRYGEPQP